MNRFISTLFLFFTTLLPIYTQSITGKVLNAQNEPIQANIILQGTVRAAQTNQDGVFNIKNINQGDYTILVSSIGYEDHYIEFSILPSEIKNFDITLKEANYTFDEIHIVATRADGRHLSEVEGLSINATKKNELIKLDRIDANLAMNNSRQIFGRVPGISIWENDGSGIQLGIASRGLSPNRSWEFNTRLNGYDITPDPMGYPEAYFTPPMEVVEKIEIIRGASSLQYGSQFGGLLNFVVRKPDLSTRFTFESQNTVGSNGLLSTFNYLGGTEGRLSYSAYYQKRKGNGWRENSYFNTDHAHLELSFAATEKLRLSAELTFMDYKNQQAGGLTDSLFKIDARKSFRSRNWFSAPWFVPMIGIDYAFNKNTKLNIKTFGILGERNSIGFTKVITIPDDNGHRQLDQDVYKNYGSEARLLSSFTLFGKNHTLASGLRYFKGKTIRRQVGKADKGTDYNMNLEKGSQYSRELEFDNINASAFAELLIKFNQRILMTAGARFEHINSKGMGRIGFKDGQPLNIQPLERERNFILLGVGFEYHTSPNQEFYTNISQAYRPVLFSDLTPPATTDIIDENLKDAKGFNFDFGYRGRLGNYLTFDIDYFYLNYDDRIGTIAQKVDNKIVNYRTNLGQSTSKGFEGYLEVKPLSFLDRNKFGNLSLFASLANINARYNDFKVTSVKNNEITEQNLSGNRVENAPENINRYGITYQYKSFSITWQLSDISDVFTDATNTVKPNSTGTVGLIPGYKVQDLSGSVKLFKNFIIKGGINNLTNTIYATRRAGGYPGPGLLPGDGRNSYISLGIKF